MNSSTLTIILIERIVLLLALRLDDEVEGGVGPPQHVGPRRTFVELLVPAASTRPGFSLPAHLLALRPAHSRGHQFRDCYPGASDISSPPCLPRLLPAGAVAAGLAPAGKAPPCHGARGKRSFASTHLGGIAPIEVAPVDRSEAAVHEKSRQRLLCAALREVCQKLSFVRRPWLPSRTVQEN
jgi:hypothetical protein